MDQLLEITGLVESGALLPALPRNPDSFKRQRAEDGRVFFAVLDPALTIGSRPGTIAHGLAGPFDKGLPQEPGAFQRQWVRSWLPLFSRTGAMPAYFCRLAGAGWAGPVGAEGHAQEKKVLSEVAGLKKFPGDAGNIIERERPTLPASPTG